MAGHASSRRRAVSVTACRRMQRDMGEEPAIGRDAGRPRPLGRADQQRRGLVDGPLAGVPPVVGVGERPVVRSGGGDVRRVAWLREGGLGVVHGHRVEARPERGDVGALAVRRERAAAAASAFSMSAYCCTRRPDHAGGDLDRGHEVRRPREHLVGRRGPPRRRRRRRRGPTPAPRHRRPRRSRRVRPPQPPARG